MGSGSGDALAEGMMSYVTCMSHSTSVEAVLALQRCTCTAMTLSPGSSMPALSDALYVVVCDAVGMQEEASVLPTTVVVGMLRSTTCAPFR